MRAHTIIPLALTLTACVDKNTDCTRLYAASVVLTVEDADGNPVDDYTAEYSVDGGPAEPCDEGTCGYEAAGSFSIVVDAVGFAEQTIQVEVSEDECHALTESVTVALQPVDCTEEALPSLIVTVLDGSDEPVYGAAIDYTAEDASGSCAPGEDALANVFTCGEEIIGDITIDVSAEGYDDHTETLTVLGDEEECHPVTEEHTVNLLLLPE